MILTGNVILLDKFNHGEFVLMMMGKRGSARWFFSVEGTK